MCIRDRPQEGRGHRHRLPQRDTPGCARTEHRHRPVGAPGAVPAHRRGAGRHRQPPVRRPRAPQGRGAAAAGPGAQGRRRARGADLAAGLRTRPRQGTARPHGRRRLPEGLCRTALRPPPGRQGLGRQGRRPGAGEDLRRRALPALRPGHQPTAARDTGGRHLAAGDRGQHRRRQERPRGVDHLLRPERPPGPHLGDVPQVAVRAGGCR